MSLADLPVKRVATGLVLLALLAMAALCERVSVGGLAEGFPAALVPPPEWAAPVRSACLALSFFLGAHLAFGIIAAQLRRTRRSARPVPKVALDLLRVVLLAAATIGSLSLFLHRDLSGFLTGSGLVLAVLGFAIRNVVADTFSGIALGLEAPFRIGDWVHIEGLAQGRVQEIGWRTTRLVTRESTYVILPNSQISRQRITNYSAPRKDYHASTELTLPSHLPVREAKTLMRAALRDAETLPGGPEVEVQVTGYRPEGVTYRLRYRVAQFDRERACRDEVISRIDAALREAGVDIGGDCRGAGGRGAPRSAPGKEAGDHAPENAGA